MNLRNWIPAVAVVMLIAIVSGTSDIALSAEPNEWVDKKVIIVNDGDDDDSKVWLGVQIEELSSNLRRKMDIKAHRGVLIMDVMEDSPAERAGFQEDDVIIQFDGKNVRRPDDITRAIRKHKAGDIVAVELERKTGKIKVDVELGERPVKWTHKLDIPELHELRVHGLLTSCGLGVQLQELNPDLAEYFGAKPDRGALITEVEDDGPADKAGLKAGDVLLSIEEEDISEPSEIADILAEYEEGDIVKVEILRKKETQTVEVELEEDFGTSLFKTDKSLQIIKPEIHVRQYRDALDRYKNDMDNYKKDMKRWRDEYKDEIKERIHEDLEKEMQQQQLEMEKLKDELNRLKEEVLELQKKVM